MRTFPVHQIVAVCFRQKTAIRDVTIQPMPGVRCTMSATNVDIFAIEPVYEDLSSCFTGLLVFKNGFSFQKVLSCLLNGRIIKISV